MVHIYWKYLFCLLSTTTTTAVMMPLTAAEHAEDKDVEVRRIPRQAIKSTTTNSINFTFVVLLFVGVRRPTRRARQGKARRAKKEIQTNGGENQSNRSNYWDRDREARIGFVSFFRLPFPSSYLGRPFSTPFPLTAADVCRYDRNPQRGRRGRQKNHTHLSVYLPVSLFLFVYDPHYKAIWCCVM